MCHAYTSAMENLLPQSISRLDKPLPSTPKMDRSVSSMTDSFFMEHPRSQTPDPERDGAHSPNPPKRDDSLTPISNWAHLSFLKNQRNTLRTELKAQQVASAEAKQSVAALRRLAFRMAVNISVKEQQIATTARNLASSRKKDYLSTRNAEKRIEELTKTLKEEEQKNREILESLEKASMLTLQCGYPILASTTIIPNSEQTLIPSLSLVFSPVHFPPHHLHLHTTRPSVRTPRRRPALLPQSPRSGTTSDGTLPPSRRQRSAQPTAV